MPTSFRDHLSFEAYSRLARHNLAFDPDARGERDVQWRKERDQLRTDLFVPAFRSFIEALKSEGRLTKVEVGEDYGILLAQRWNQMMAGEEIFSPDSPHLDRAWELLHENGFHRTLFDSTKSVRARLRNKETVDIAAELPVCYEGLVRGMDEGNVSWLDAIDSHTSSETGQRCLFEMRDWKLIFGAIDYSHAGGDFIPLQPLVPEVIRITPVEFKTGHLLIADWIRIDEFSKAVDYDYQFDINCSRGAADASVWYAQERGFTCVNVGNTCPSIFQEGGTLVVGHPEDFDEEYDGPFKKLGKVCTDLQWATIIDKERLVEIIASRLEGSDSADRAREKVEAYLAENDVTELQVQPGTYFVHHMGRHERFTERFASDDLDTSRLEPYFIVANKPLALKDQPRKSPKP